MPFKNLTELKKENTFIQTDKWLKGRKNKINK